MKMIRGTSALVLAAATGAVLHRLTARNEPRHPTAPVPSLTSSAGQTTTPAQSLSDELMALHDDAVARETLLASFTSEQFASLAEAVLNSEPTRERQGLLYQVESFWAQVDAKAVLAFVRRVGNKEGHPHIVSACFRTEPEGALAVMDQFKAEGMKAEDFDPMLDNAFRTFDNPAATLAAAEKHGLLHDEKHPYRINEVVQTLAKQDATAARAFAEKHPEYLKAALAGWSDQQPEAVMDWLRANPQDNSHSINAVDVLMRIAEKHPQYQEQLLEMTTDPEGIYRHLAQAKSKHQQPVEELVAWLDSLPPEGQTVAHEELCKELKYADPAKAAALCMSFPELGKPQSPEQSATPAEQAVIAWSKLHPVGAIQDYQAGKIPTDMAERILPELVESWWQMDRAAAMAFVHAQPDREMKGRLLLQTSRITKDGDAEAARDYALSLPEPELRLGACRAISKSNSYSLADAQRDEWIASIPDEALRQALRPPAK